ncbi:MAG: hypothetical protein RMJ98_06330 [Myxococcales bacterium]|nr:hypothetical protein [Polyangiaceae bacterium]MDW8248905.1 hypothetical protein [Myxococcales bacterium]
MMNDARDLYVELHIPPEWSRIDPVRQAVGLCVAAVLGSEDLRDALGMVCAELLENAIKYGTSDPHGVRLVLQQSIQGNQKEVILSVINAVERTSHHLTALQQRIEWIRSYKTPAEAYMAALTMVYERAEDHGGEGGLGLVRIAYEGGCQLDCDSPAEGYMAVHARCLVPMSDRDLT